MASDSPSPAAHRAPTVAVLGADALLAAQPATPVQLAHACHQVGFGAVVPVSWGDELVAAEVLRQLAVRGTAPAIQCSCPLVAHRILRFGPELRESIASTVAPPVAVARYIRAAYGDRRPRITYIGACPSAADPEFDGHIRPAELLAMLVDHGISVVDQPTVYESVIPPDRRRHLSTPGGMPSLDALRNAGVSLTVAAVEGREIAAEIAQLLLSREPVLVDAAPAIGCLCAGAVAGVRAADARAHIESLEPPRAPAPVVDHGVALELQLELPGAARAPSDVATPRQIEVVPSVPPRTPALDQLPGLQSAIPPFPATPPRPSPVRPFVSPGDARRDAAEGAPAENGHRSREKRSLPRTYVARRRSTPRGIVRQSPPRSVAAQDEPTRQDDAQRAPDAALEAAADEVILAAPDTFDAAVPDEPVRDDLAVPETAEDSVGMELASISDEFAIQGESLHVESTVESTVQPAQHSREIDHAPMARAVSDDAPERGLASLDELLAISVQRMMIEPGSSPELERMAQEHFPSEIGSPGASLNGESRNGESPVPPVPERVIARPDDPSDADLDADATPAAAAPIEEPQAPAPEAAAVVEPDQPAPAVEPPHPMPVAEPEPEPHQQATVLLPAEREQSTGILLSLGYFLGVAAIAAGVVLLGMLAVRAIF